MQARPTIFGSEISGVVYRVAKNEVMVAVF
jgi:hypothetical protein